MYSTHGLILISNVPIAEPYDNVRSSIFLDMVLSFMFNSQGES